MKKDGPVTHYVAVQKDVTLVRKQSTSPVDWTSAEVALWLDEFPELHVLSLTFAEAGIDGSRLLAFDERGLFSFLLAIF